MKFCEEHIKLFDRPCGAIATIRQYKRWFCFEHWEGKDVLYLEADPCLCGHGRARHGEDKDRTCQKSTCDCYKFIPQRVVLA